MSKYIKVEDAIEAAKYGCSSWDGGYFPSMDGPIKEEFDAVADKCIDLVRCGECKYDGHCVHQIYVMQKDRNTFFCADGERRSDGE